MIQNKVAIVTGASRGIGRAIALRLAKEGALVVVHYGHSSAEAEETVKAIAKDNGQAFALQADTGDPKSIKQFFEKLDAELTQRTGEAKFDILVNNAGINTAAMFEEMTETDLDRLFDVNVKGVYVVTQMASPRLREGGRIINLSSGLTRFSYPQYIAYASTKGAINVFTQMLAAHLGQRKITVNAIAAGAIDTDINAEWLKDNPTAQQQMSQIAALGRVGQVDDIAAVAAFLASEDSKWITGQIIEASGGAHL